MHHLSKDLIAQYYAAFNKQDMKTFFDLLTDDVAHDINQGKREVGKEAFKKFMEHMNHCYQEKIVDLVIFTEESGKQAAAEFVVEGCYIKTDQGLPEAKNQRYALPVGAFFEIRQQKIARVTNYYNLQEWLRQIGAK